MLSHTNLKIQSPRLRGEAITPRLQTLLSLHIGVTLCNTAHKANIK